MAITSLGSVGGNSQKVSATTITFTPTQALSVGDWVVVWANRDSNWNFAPDEIQNCTMKCEDDGGNYYNALFCSYVPDDGRSNLSAMFLTRVRDTFDTGVTVTLTTNFATGISGFPAWGVSAWAFQCDPTKRLALMVDNTFENGSNVAAIPSISFPFALPSREYLFLHMLGAEAPETDAYTWDADYTQIDTHGTTGSFPTSNWSVLGGFRIVTATGDTVLVTADTGTRRYHQAIAALTEVDYHNYLPSAPILDNFVRANEDPLASPPWLTTDQPGFGSALMRVVSDEAAKSASGTGHGSQTWDDTFTSNDFECYFTQTAGSVASGSFHATGSGAASTLDAYGWGRRQMPGWVDYCWYFGRPGFNNDPTTDPMMMMWAPLVLPAHQGCQFISPVVHFWLGLGAAWEWVGAVWFNVPKTGGTTGIDAGGDANTRITDFGAGDAVPPPSDSVKLPHLHVGP